MAVEHPHDGRNGSRCPDAETLAAYLDGTLDPPTRDGVEAHLADCAACRAGLAETMTFLREDAARPAAAPAAPRRVPFRSTARRTGLIAALAAAAAVLIVAWVAPQWRPWPAAGDTPELQALMAAVAKEPARPVEGRLAGGFAYGPPPSVVRGPAGAALQPETQLAIERIRQRMSPASSDAHTLAVARLVAADTTGAIAALEAARTLQPQSAAVLNDLAAAHLARGRQSGDRTDFVQAREAAKHALRLDRTFAPAYFNLGLAYEALGASVLARDAWRGYLAIDSSSEWAREAQRHLNASQSLRIAPASRGLVFRQVASLTGTVGHTVFKPLKSGPDANVQTGPGDFSASFYVDIGDYCTATLVGSKVAVTAAHCLDGTNESVSFFYKGNYVHADCVTADGFEEETFASDWALCHLAPELKGPDIKYEVINTDPALVVKGNSLLVTGFGSERQAASGQYEPLFSPVVVTIAVPPSAASERLAVDGNVLFQRDSGGAGFAYFGPNFSARVQVAVNSTRSGNAQDQLAAFASEAGHKFLEKWDALHPGDLICGAYSQAVDCRNPRPPGAILIR